VTEGQPSGTTAAPEVEHTLWEYEVVAATGFGPRVVSLRRGDSPNPFARLSPDVFIDQEPGEVYRFWGGHRLWVSPEVPAITYAPDDHECDVSFGTDSLTISAPSDRAGFEKSLHIVADGETLRVEHRLHWTGQDPVSASPWAITQLPLGGVAILPVAGAADGSPLQADRSLVIWPYTRLDDDRISWKADSVLIHTRPGEPIKLGSGPSPRAIGYLRDGYLFTKRFESAEGEYPDRGAVAQIYANDSFCELEGLAPLARLEPGDEISHVEFWEVTLCPDLNSAVSAVTKSP